MKIQLDIKKLLGFRIAGELKTGAKIGGKDGVKNQHHIKLDV